MSLQPPARSSRRRVGALAAALCFAALSLTCGGCATSPNELIVYISRGDDETKSEAIVKLGEVLADKEAAGFPFTEGDIEALELLKDVASDDENPVHRMQAISALRALKRFDHTDIYLAGLTSESWGVRWKSAEALQEHPDPRTSEKLVEQMRRESNKVVAMALVKAMAASEDRVCLQGLLEAFLDPARRFEDHELKIHEALRRWTGKTWSITQTSEWRAYHRAEFLSKEPGS